MQIDRSTAETYSGWFRCLSEPTRILLLHALATRARPMTVAELVEHVDVGQPTVSHHLKALRETGFVYHERRGASSLYTVNRRCIERFPSAAEIVMGVARAPNEADAISEVA